MADAARVLLVSPDLMVASRIAGLATACGVAVDTSVSLDANPPGTGYRVAILDLQGLRGDAADLVSRARARLATVGPPDGAGPALVAFGPHVATDVLAAARAAGADEVVSRGQLLGDFASIVARHAG